MRDEFIKQFQASGKVYNVINYGFDAERFLRKKNAAHFPYRTTTYRRLKRSRLPIILNIASYYGIHKNFETLLRAVQQMKAAGLRFKLVLTLSQHESFHPEPYERFKAELQAAKLDEDIVLVGNSIEYELMSHLYGLADVFVYPTLLESFGHPLLEAMSIPSAIVASRVQVNEELAGDAVRYFSPQDAQDCAAVLTEVLQSARTTTTITYGRSSKNFRLFLGNLRTRTHSTL